MKRSRLRGAPRAKQSEARALLGSGRVVSERLRDECPNVHQFASICAAHSTIVALRIGYNQCGPHHSLGHLTPKELADQRQANKRLTSDPSANCCYGPLDMGGPSL